MKDIKISSYHETYWPRAFPVYPKALHLLVGFNLSEFLGYEQVKMVPHQLDGHLTTLRWGPKTNGHASKFSSL